MKKGNIKERLRGLGQTQGTGKLLEEKNTKSMMRTEREEGMRIHDIDTKKVMAEIQIITTIIMIVIAEMKEIESIRMKMIREEKRGLLHLDPHPLHYYQIDLYLINSKLTIILIFKFL